MWNYKEKEITTEDIPSSAIGFIYRITNLIDNRMYIGKKLLTKAGKKKPLMLKDGTLSTKRNTKTRTESDWKNYFSSCDELKADVKKLGKDNFKREIICFTYSLITHTYLENKYLYVNEVLESDNYYNANISNRLFKVYIKDKINISN